MTNSAAIPFAANWVLPQNVRGLASYLSHLVGYDFDDTDWGAIEFGLESTDYERGVWFTYPIGGTPALELALAAEREAEPVHVQLRYAGDIDPDLLIRIETTLSIFNCFDLH